MRTMQRLKDELSGNAELMDLFNVKKYIAVLQFRALERKRRKFIKFTRAFESFFRMIDFTNVFYPLANPKTNKLGIIIITSNEGFVGSLNNEVISTAFAQPGADKAEIIIVGERGIGYLKEAGKNFKAFKGADSSEERYELALNLKNYVINEVKSEKFGRLILSYSSPISFMVQRIDVVKMLPVARMFWAKKETQEEKPAIKKRVIIESPLEHIIEYLAEIWVLEKLLEVLEESKLAEFAARTVQLEKSYQELGKKENYLKSQYLRAYHGAIDENMREIFSAQVIRKRKLTG